ncbi:hypothetical protein M2371_003073 [Buttiauxella sp. BIGb0471]|uniref:YbjP/YqhG family protein n=1 Tax=Buttiauxella sp. BIGb0471 TaxID=2940597 RepID=UPI00216A7794|nr:YbjP/YqhG family protein [Buttiauxella sp. BIGb0471]MCS3603838.1 hypothetical protein [Buttiauxella sp. BIGb0471]
MRALLLIFCMTLASCTAHIESPENRVEQFYLFYLNAFVSNNHQDDLDSAQMRDFVANDTRLRLKEVMSIYEQEIIGADYFTYAQDYAPEWMAGLKIGKSQDYMGGEALEVRLGCEGGKSYPLKVYLRLEEGKWKIYRVRAGDGYEQDIFDDKAIAAARAYAATIND